MPLSTMVRRFFALLLLGLVTMPAAAAQQELPRPLVELPIAEQTSPNQDDRAPGSVIDTIVVHDTKSPGVRDASAIARWFGRPDAEVSAHYVIGKAGEIVQCVPDAKRAWHAGPSHFQGRVKVNNFSIGIELVNDESGVDPFSEAQYASLIALTADLMTRYPAIGLDRIVGHRHVTDYPLERHDPADNFDWPRYLRGVQLMLATQQVRRVTTADPLARGGIGSGVRPN